MMLLVILVYGSDLFAASALPCLMDHSRHQDSVDEMSPGGHAMSGVHAMHSSHGMPAANKVGQSDSDAVDGSKPSAQCCESDSCSATGCTISQPLMFAAIVLPSKPPLWSVFDAGAVPLQSFTTSTLFRPPISA